MLLPLLAHSFEHICKTAAAAAAAAAPPPLPPPAAAAAAAAAVSLQALSMLPKIYFHHGLHR